MRRVLLASSLAYIIGFVVLLPVLTLAQGLVPSDCAQGDAKDCGIDDFLLLGSNIYQRIFQLLGSVTLIVFVYGGLVWLTAAGNTQRIEHGRKVFEGALIGLVIIFGSWIIVNFMVAALTGQTPGEGVQLFPGSDVERPAFEVPTQ